jgi:N-acetylglucosaminyldiphosphoundecaprenol N-acetyl-beta-D-mannosaminyltransferase
MSILGGKVDAFSLQDCLDSIVRAIRSHQKILLTYANIHALNLAYEQPRFRSFLNRADIVFCDGFGVRLGAALLGQRLQHRFTPPDWLGQLSTLCAQHGYSIYLLGARPGIAEKAAALLKRDHPALNIAGTQHGYFDKTPGSPENEAVLAEINRVKPNILIVGFGMPLQEYWLEENWDRIEANVALTAGAAFDYISGEVRRAPRWMTDNGLEWLGRLIIEPRRLWKRYILGIPLFFARVLLQRFGLLRLPAG